MKDKNKNIVNGHYQKRTITVVQHIPEHFERKETLEFRNAKHELEKVEHLPCFICGTMEKRESHHIFERSFWNALDLKRVVFFLFHHYDYHGHVNRDFKSKEELFQFFIEHYNGRLIKGVDDEGNKYEYWTCDDTAADVIYNQLILDSVCHRENGVGAHGCDAATFTARMAQRKGYEVSISLEEYEELTREQGEVKDEKLV